jgi:hypothetical protein
LRFFAAALAGRTFGFGFDFGFAFDFVCAFGAATRPASFAAVRFPGTGFAGAVFLPWLPDPPFTGFPSAS